MNDKTVAFQYKFGVNVYDATYETTDEDWANMDDDERLDVLREVARDEFEDGFEVIESSINDED